MTMSGDSTPPAVKILDASVQALMRWEQNNTGIDDFLEFYLPYPELRRSIASVLFTFFRRKKVIDSAINHHATQPVFDDKLYILEIALTQCLFQSAVPIPVAVSVAVEKMRREVGVSSGNFANALLRRVLADPPKIKETAQDIFPPTIFKRWKKLMPKKMNSMVQTFLSLPGFTCRGCGDFRLPEEKELFFDFAEPYHFYQVSEPGKLLASQEFADGKLYIQDPATSLPFSLIKLRGDERVCDLCSAPGGKSLLFAEQLNKAGFLLMLDRSEARQRLTRENFSRRQLELTYQIEVGDAAGAKGEFDVVLCDVPCSNTGVFRRRPDALWRFSEENLLELEELQYRILSNAAKLVKRGGSLLYSTCSIDPGENGEQIAMFVQHNPEFKIEKQRQLYPSTEHDGAYAALLIKK